ncbi:MAG: hypothetical protein PQJ61_09615 [Spirochaetales bacterium]|uniref:Uncharacterized protein n=1 Tax=Candidatus Thalassospirochaeta sargassi TaxID=3119039 RepID=A0AAJ1ICY1_9SPIO|nr:hypothetical protein [Spirochaetales bacterium]
MNLLPHPAYNPAHGLLPQTVGFYPGRVAKTRAEDVAPVFALRPIAPVSGNRAATLSLPGLLIKPLPARAAAAHPCAAIRVNFSCNFTGPHQTAVQ